MRAVVYIATSKEKYLTMAVNSATSLRATGYDGHIRIITCFEAPTIFNSVYRIHPQEGWQSRSIKTRLPHFCKDLDQALYVDCDTKILRPIDDVWKLLTHPICMAGHPFELSRKCRTVGEFCERFPGKESTYTLNVCEPDMTFWNAGVMLFKPNAARDVFNRWYAEWLKFRAHDQSAFCRAVAESPGIVGTLPLEYNYPYPGYTTIIYHGYWDWEGKKQFITPDSSVTSEPALVEV